MDHLIRALYQAAGDPRQWEPALEQVALRFRSASASFLSYRGIEAIRCYSTPAMREVAQAFIDQRMWEQDGRIRHFLQVPIHDWVTAEQYFPPEMLAQNEVARAMAAIGLHHEAGTIARVADGDELAVFALDRLADEGPFLADELVQLNRLRGHLVGAAQLMHHLSHQHVQHTAATLQAIGQAAAVLDRQGAIVACNALFEADFPQWGVQGARGRFRPQDPQAQAQLAAALAKLHGNEAAPAVQARGQQGVVRQLQLRPLIGPTAERLLGAHALLLVDRVAAAVPTTTQARLRQRHGLTEREADLACLLAAGGDLKQCADALHLAYNSARTYLTRIHTKMGTRRLAELVRMVLSAG